MSGLVVRGNLDDRPLEVRTIGIVDQNVRRHGLGSVTDGVNHRGGRCRKRALGRAQIRTR